LAFGGPFQPELVGQCFRGSQNHPVNQLEIPDATIIGIGDFNRLSLGNLGEQSDTGCSITGLALGYHPHVVTVHSEDEIKAAEISRSQLTATLRGNIKPVHGCHAHRTLIWRFASVITVGARRIDQHIANAACFKHLPHHAFGERRTADIARADEKNAGRFLYGHGTLALMIS